MATPIQEIFTRRSSAQWPALPSLQARAMAIFRLRVNIVSRSRGQSIIASAAYRAGEKLHDPNRLRDHDYTRKTGVEHTQIMAPENAPAWVQTAPGNEEQQHAARQELWQRV